MNWPKTLRRLCQIVFLTIFVFLLYRAVVPVSLPIEVGAFLRADPLSAAVTFLALPHLTGVIVSRFLPAVLLLILTAIFGRFFCGWICPLGTCIDVFHTIFIRPFRKRDSVRANSPQLKYYILAAVLIAALFGAQLAWLGDPIPLITRAAVPIFRGLTYPLAAYSLAAFAIVLALSVLSRRYWCRTLCPLGALLALVGRFGLWRRQVAPTCTHCMLCRADCKMGAIPQSDPCTTRTAECILCYDCVNCKGCVSTRIGIFAASAGINTAVDTSRRRLIGSVAAGVGLGLLGRIPVPAVQNAIARKRDERLIRSPGAHVRQNGVISGLMTEDDFRSQCLRCGECMKVCPTGVLQPASFEGGADGFYTPILITSEAFCDPRCNACGSVCPSGALRDFLPEEKSRIHIAEARIDHTTCLSWQKGKAYVVCLRCVGECPYDAVSAQDVDGSGQFRPVVDTNVCVGCGRCEVFCPVKPVAAIRTYRRDA